MESEVERGGDGGSEVQSDVGVVRKFEAVEDEVVRVGIDSERFRLIKIGFEHDIPGVYIR